MVSSIPGPAEISAEKWKRDKKINAANVRQFQSLFIQEYKTNFLSH